MAGELGGELVVVDEVLVGEALLWIQQTLTRGMARAGAGVARGWAGWRGLARGWRGAGRDGAATARAWRGAGAGLARESTCTE